MRRLFSVLLLIPLLLLTACSDDDGGSQVATAPTNAPAATATLDAPADAAIAGSIRVDFTGAPEELDAIDLSFEVPEGTKAWDAIKEALGEENLSFQDFGGDLGIFITGFNGVQAQGNHFWEFRINGETAGAGVSAYVIQPDDVLEFVYSSF